LVVGIGLEGKGSWVSYGKMICVEMVFLFVALQTQILEVLAASED
jgi:hypothetical protein